MYIHLGEDTVVNDSDIVGIFDLENTSISKHTRTFLRQAEQLGQVINVSYELPRSFVICQERGATKVYISQISTATLRLRAKRARLGKLGYT